MPCPVPDDAMIRCPSSEGAVALAGMDAGSLEARPSPLPAPPPQGIEECVFSQLRERSGRGLAGYRATGGYQALERALGGMGPDGVISELEISGLSGRGGAGFPTWRKWKAVREAPGDPKSIVCNADEGEPGCFKDRTLMDHDPHAVLEGMILAGYVTGAPRGFIYLRYEYPDTARILEEAIQEAEYAGFLGEKDPGHRLLFPDLPPARGRRLYLRRGDLPSQLSGGEAPLPAKPATLPGHPRVREPPYGGQQRGDAGQRTADPQKWGGLVSGSRTGRPRWDQGHQPVWGHPEAGELRGPMGFPLQTLLNDWAGGPGEGRTIQAVTMAGLSGGFLAGEDLAVTLDEPMHPGEGLLPGSRWHHGLRRHAGHGRGGSHGHGVLCRRVLREVFPLSHRYPTPHGAPGRRGRTWRPGGLDLRGEGPRRPP